MQPSRVKGVRTTARFLGELNTGQLVYATKNEEGGDEDVWTYSKSGRFFQDGKPSGNDLENIPEEER
jgi:hypothetical protein